ncbi:hypothetical protein [Candidatus Enterococcus clewellii]|uniref:Uncharacterized protein n=1 Tax=Candidatus Enterococcus clewellii TaxID=1834193 RepID=A0A242K3D2_9ENTE|nr:hypothetical protein [Enterococcus sp. 9E7_DIV0242]OTP13423.1 hypothetical protein A5888_002901 [Enterococcus sp. 9E7_DIV0242]
MNTLKQCFEILGAADKDKVKRVIERYILEGDWDIDVVLAALLIAKANDKSRIMNVINAELERSVKNTD